jgi:hypothetical protein
VSDLGNIAVSIASGVGTGVVSSFGVWWWLGRRMQPSVEICPTLATFISGDGGRRTQFRIRNTGRRDVFEIKVRVSLRMASLLAPGVIEWVLLKDAFVTALPAGNSRRWSIKPEQADDLRRYVKYLPGALRAQYEAGTTIHLTDFFREMPEATLRVAVFATDAYSGARGYDEATFSLRSIKSGRFLGEGCDHAPSEDWLRGDSRRVPAPVDHPAE